MIASIIWIGISAFAVLIAWLSRRQHCLIMASLLLIGNVAYNLSWYFPTDDTAWWAIMDLALSAAAWDLFMRRHEIWKAGVFFALLGQCVGHLLNRGELIDWDSYIFALDALYAAQLACIFFEGGKHVWSDRTWNDRTWRRFTLRRHGRANPQWLASHAIHERAHESAGR